jgi:hypothetical protein
MPVLRNWQEVDLKIQLVMLSLARFSLALELLLLLI